MRETEQETAFIELKSQLASSHVMAYFSQEAEARDTRGYSSRIRNNHEPKADVAHKAYGYSVTLDL